jgi:hypothetical protein
MYATTRYNFVGLKATHKIFHLEELVGGRSPPSSSQRLTGMPEHLSKLVPEHLPKLVPEHLPTLVPEHLLKLVSENLPKTVPKIY